MSATASSTSVPSPPGLQISTIRSDVVIAFRPDGHVHVCGVFHAHDTTTRLPTRHMWLEDVRLWPAAVRKYTAVGYNNFQFTEFSSPDRWEINLERQDRIRSVTGIDDASARRAKPKGKSPATPSPTPAPALDKASYPPSAKPSFQTIVEFIKGTSNCPGCFNRGKGGKRCGKECCLPLLAAGWICKFAPDEAKKIYGELRAKQKNNNEKGRKAAESAPPPADNKDKKEVEQAKRATSVQCGAADRKATDVLF